MNQFLILGENAVKKDSGHIEFHITRETLTVSHGLITPIAKKHRVGNDSQTQILVL
jgi:hypothetical protein